MPYIKLTKPHLLSLLAVTVDNAYQIEAAYCDGLIGCAQAE